MFEIEKRSGKLGNHVNVRTEARGDEEVVTAFDVTLKDIPLEKAETNVLLKDPNAYDCLFRPAENGGLAQVAFPCVKSLRLKDKIGSARVEINIGQGRPVVLPDSALARIALERKEGGTCLMSAQVQCIPNIDEGGARLLKRLGADITVSIRAQNEQQALELPERTGDQQTPAKGKRRSRKTKAEDSPPAKGRRGGRARKANGANSEGEQLPA